MRVAHGRTAQQLSDLRLAGAAIGAGLEAPADIFDARRPFADFSRDLMLPDAEARAHDLSDILTGTATEPDLVDRLKLDSPSNEGPTGFVGVIQEACVKSDIRAFGDKAGSANRPVSHDRETSL